ncbi:MAG: aldehyde dehydrogenase family protein [Actinomycetes bacterium]
MSATGTATTHDSHFIAGEWVTAESSERLEVINSATEQVMGSVPAGTAEEVGAAVAAAQAAFGDWSAVPPWERAQLMAAVGAELSGMMEEIAVLVAQELGMPVAQAATIQAGLPAMTFGSMPELVEQVEWERRIGNSLILSEPVGVVGAITPWNYPLHQVAAKVAPALTAGCTLVLKPSEVTPLTAFLLAEVFERVGLPAGVFNLVCGTGPVVGEAIASHPGVDMVSFTGSTGSGKRVSELAASTVKKVSLELGGKSANVVLDDADFTRAIPNGVAKCFLNSGQTCSALTRMLVPRSRLAEAEAIAAATAEAFAPGDPFEPTTVLGPLVSAVQRDRVRGFIERGIAEGAKLVCGGPEAPEGLETGFFVRPTVFSEVDNSMTIARQEIFGPVLSIIPYDTEDEAAGIANDSDYGLAGGVWSEDEERATAFARRMRTGQVEVNGAAFNPMAPFGGFKQSGHGRELGPLGLEEFLTAKSLQL